MSASATKAGPLLLGMLVVLFVLAVALIVMGSYPIGIALLAVAAALFPTALKSMKPAADDGQPGDRS
jgi:hypothetical protein